MSAVTPVAIRPLRATSHWAILILLCAFALRMAVLMQGAELPIVRDEAQYVASAEQLRGDPFAYTEIYRPPLYAAFVAVSFLISGGERFGVGTLQALLDAANVALVYALTRRLFRRSRVALLAAGLYAVYPEAVALTRQFYSETLFNFFVLITFYLLVRFTPTRARVPLLGAGIVFGLAALTREWVLFFALLGIPLWFFICAGRSGHAPLLQTALFGAGFLLVLLPWTLRNYEVEGRFIPIATEGEKNLLQDNLKAQARVECGNQSASPNAGPRKCIPFAALSRQMLDNAPDGTQMSVAVRGAWEVVATNPLAWLNAKTHTLKRFWAPPQWRLSYFRVETLAGTGRSLFNAIVGSYHILVLLSAVLGFVVAQDDAAKLLVLMYLLYGLMIFILTHFQARYREPFFVLFMPYAALGIAFLYELVRGRTSVRQWITQPRAYAASFLLGLTVLLMFENYL